MFDFSNLPEGLPPLDHAAQAQSEAVARLLQSEIAANAGVISFARFMHLALYAPGLGYYSAGSRKFGEAGDFVTAPELSPLFSYCLARQTAQVLRSMGGGDVLEVGAGSGVMACDVLAELARNDALPRNYFILEVSADLRARQRALLSERLPHLVDRCHWLDGFPEAGFCGVVLGNEVLDAMPVHRFRIDDDGISETCVTMENRRFVWRDALLHSGALFDSVHRLERTIGERVLLPGYVSEINLALPAWVANIEAMLKQGVVLLIDYGFGRREYYHPQRSAGTIMCHYRHRSHPDPLILPGLQDITAHVDFTAVAEAAAKAGLDVLGYTTQAFFLIASGLEQMMSESDPSHVQHHLALAQQVKKLTMPSEMGELFKVIALGKSFDEELSGFSLVDQRGRL